MSADTDNSDDDGSQMSDDNSGKQSDDGNDILSWSTGNEYVSLSDDVHDTSDDDSASVMGENVERPSDSISTPTTSGTHENVDGPDGTVGTGTSNGGTCLDGAGASMAMTTQAATVKDTCGNVSSTRNMMVMTPYNSTAPNENSISNNTEMVEDTKRAALGTNLPCASCGMDMFPSCTNLQLIDLDRYEGLLTPEHFNIMDVVVALRNKERASIDNDTTTHRRNSSPCNVASVDRNESGSHSPPQCDVACVSNNMTNEGTHGNVARTLEPTMLPVPYGHSLGSSVGTASPLAFQYILMSEHARVPTQGTNGSAGFDLYSPYDAVIPPHETVFLPLDIQLQPPPQHYGRTDLRSSLALKGLSSPAGTIDPDYTGPIHMLIRNHNEEEYHVNKHDRIGQVIFERFSVPVPEQVRSFEPTARGSNGFGSTGL
jgi:dUTP pyrophosphatase